MHSNQENKIIRTKNRRLGDEWVGWKGDLKDYEKNADAGKRIFLGILLVTILSAGFFLFFLWYMISPRLAQFHPSIPMIFGFIVLTIWGILALWFFFMVLSILTGKDFFMHLWGKEFSITFLVPIVLRFGNKFGIPKDRMGNSFVKVSNTLIRTAVKKVKPEAIIGVACERDLLSGIQDVITKIPVIGIPNMRPEGPCKNTIIDIGEFEKAIQTFLGLEVKLAGDEKNF